MKQETVSGSGVISWAICNSAPRSRQITMPAPHHSFFTGRMPFLLANQEQQSTEGMGTALHKQMTNQQIVSFKGNSLQASRHLKLLQNCLKSVE